MFIRQNSETGLNQKSLVNLNLVKHIGKIDESSYGKINPSIVFEHVNHTYEKPDSVTWIYKTFQDRDKQFEEIYALVGPKNENYYGR